MKGGGEEGDRMFFVSLLASVMSFLNFDRLPRRNSDVLTTVLHTCHSPVKLFSSLQAALCGWPHDGIGLPKR